MAAHPFFDHEHNSESSRARALGLLRHPEQGKLMVNSLNVRVCTYGCACCSQ